MKTILIVFLFIHISITALHSTCSAMPVGVDSSMKAKVQIVIERFLPSLNHDNNGVVTSALINIIQIKLRYPDLNYDRIVLKLQELQQLGRTENIRLLSGICKKCLCHTGDPDFIFDLDMKETRKLLPLLLGQAY